MAYVCYLNFFAQKTMTMKKILLALMVLVSVAVAAQKQEPAPAQKQATEQKQADQKKLSLTLEVQEWNLVIACLEQSGASYTQVRAALALVVPPLQKQIADTVSKKPVITGTKQSP